MSIKADAATCALFFAIKSDSPFCEKPNTDMYLNNTPQALTDIVNEPALK